MAAASVAETAAGGYIAAGYNATAGPAQNPYQGSSLLAMIELGKQKGYELVCTLGCNAFFVPREDSPLFGIENNHIDAMFDDTRTETRVFQCYDGTLVLAGKKSLNWHKIDFCDEDIQILPASLRRYGKRLDVSSPP